MIKPAGAALVMLAIAGGVMAADVPEWNSALPSGATSKLSFRDITMGDSVALHGEKLACRTAKPATGGDMNCVVRALGKIGCVPEDVPGSERCFDNRIRKTAGDVGGYIGGLRIDALIFEIWQGRFSGFAVYVPAESFDTLRTMAEGKWGAPSDVKKELITNRAGAAFENVIVSWETPHGSLVAKKYTQKVTQSALSFNDLSVLTEISRVRRQAEREAGKKAF